MILAAETHVIFYGYVPISYLSYPGFYAFFVWVLISLYSKFYLFGSTEIDRSVYCHSLLNLWYSLVIHVCAVSTFFFSFDKKKEKEEECCYDSDE